MSLVFGFQVEENPSEELQNGGNKQSTQTSFIIMRNKCRFPASGLGAERRANKANTVTYIQDKQNSAEKGVSLNLMINMLSQTKNSACNILLDATVNQMAEFLLKITKGNKLQRLYHKNPEFYIKNPETIPKKSGSFCFEKLLDCSSSSTYVSIS